MPMDQLPLPEKPRDTEGCGGAAEADPGPRPSDLSQGRQQVLKSGEVFAIFDGAGDISPHQDAKEGLYHRDTRHLSRLRLTIEGRPLEVLSTGVSLRSNMLVVEAANPDLQTASGPVARETVHVQRSTFLWDGGAFERISVRNHGLQSAKLELALAFAADFADIFEARGFDRGTRGAVHATLDTSEVRFAYGSADGERRETRLAFWPAPDRLSDSMAAWQIQLAPHESHVIFVRIGCTAEAPEGRALGYFSALRRSRRGWRTMCRRSVRVTSSDPIVNEIFGRARSDLCMLTTETEYGLYPFAGVPWFAAPFGRDGLITSLLTLWTDPAIARGTLTYLAAVQAQTDDPATDAEPGKILHEGRSGELARLGTIPFRRYYGAIDSTPLFLVLAGAYLKRTGDVETIRTIGAAVDRAVNWLCTFGDPDADGFIEYLRRRPDGLRNQGWKDSDDSVFHRDGRLAEGPIALVEVQGYAYAAWLSASRIALALGDAARSADYATNASLLRDQIERHFWDDELGTYALALDGAKEPCLVRSSNAGHLLFCGVPGPDRAAAVAASLSGPQAFSGFGIRTLAQGEARYNPMSYHNGSIWPHDNAMIALGLSAYGFKREALRVFEAMLLTAEHMDLKRLPELFCGFRRRRGRGPSLYPRACAPQAWAAAAPFGALAAALGLGFDAETQTVRLDRPRLPARLDWLRLEGVGIGDGRADLLLRRVGDHVSVDVLRRDGSIEIAVTC